MLRIIFASTIIIAIFLMSPERRASSPPISEVSAAMHEIEQGLPQAMATTAATQLTTRGAAAIERLVDRHRSDGSPPATLTSR